MIPSRPSPPQPAPSRAIWVWALLPLVLLAALVAAIVRLEPAERLRPDGMPPVERLTIERATLAADGIHLTVLNDGPDPVTIAQVTVDDAYWAFTSEQRSHARAPGRTTIHVPYPWVAGEAHLVKILTSTGHGVRARDRGRGRDAEADRARISAAFALIGLYVGVLPVALGLCWFPVLARLGAPRPRRPARAHDRPARVPVRRRRAGRARRGRGARRRRSRARRCSSAPPPPPTSASRSSGQWLRAARARAARPTPHAPDRCSRC